MREAFRNRPLESITAEMPWFGEERRKAVAAELAVSYTMASERNVLNSRDEDSGADVELF